MEARELRIGNWIQSNGIPYQATISTYKILQDDRGIIEKPHHIPLTEEWLLRFGFKKEGEFYSYRLLNDWTVLYFNLSNGKILTELSVNKHSCIIFCNYVHSLQNLIFALTGKELTMKKS